MGDALGSSPCPAAVPEFRHTGAPELNHSPRATEKERAPPEDSVETSLTTLLREVTWRSSAVKLQTLRMAVEKASSLNSLSKRDLWHWELAPHLLPSPSSLWSFPPPRVSFPSPCPQGGSTTTISPQPPQACQSPEECSYPGWVPGCGLPGLWGWGLAEGKPFGEESPPVLPCLAVLPLTSSCLLARPLSFFPSAK